MPTVTALVVVTDQIAMAANAVAEWAAILANQPGDAHALGDTIPVHRVQEIQRPNGKALA